MENKESYSQKRQNLIKNNWAARNSFITNLFMLPFTANMLKLQYIMHSFAQKI